MAKNTAKPSTNPLFSWVETLLTSKKPLEQRNKELNFASAWADDQTVILLLQEGADPNSLDNKGDPNTAPLLECVEYGTMDGLQQANHFHRTYGQRVSTVTHLIRAGADIHCRDSLGYTPLHRAAFYENREVVALLLKHGADPSVTYFSTLHKKMKPPSNLLRHIKGNA